MGIEFAEALQRAADASEVLPARRDALELWPG
jgi:hypothetical protein